MHSVMCGVEALATAVALKNFHCSLFILRYHFEICILIFELVSSDTRMFQHIVKFFHLHYCRESQQVHDLAPLTESSLGPHYCLAVVADSRRCYADLRG